MSISPGTLVQIPSLMCHLIEFSKLTLPNVNWVRLVAVIWLLVEKGPSSLDSLNWNLFYLNMSRVKWFLSLVSILEYGGCFFYISVVSWIISNIMNNIIEKMNSLEQSFNRELGEYCGTLSQCRSLKLQKTVRYLSEICQKTVDCRNVSENSHKCVRIVSENCQSKYLSEIYQKLFGNASEMCLIS